MSVFTSKRDTAGAALEAGKRYRLGRFGKMTATVVLIEEDPTTSDLIARTDSYCSRLDDMDPALVFEPLIQDPDCRRARLQQLAERADVFRAGLDEMESLMLRELSVGRDTDVGDYVMHLVRDGFGDVDRLIEMVSDC